MKPELTKQQRQWVAEQVEGYDCIYLGFYGSHLYGVSTETSDIDLKAVYLPKASSIFNKDIFRSINKKNKELDIEIELKSIFSFINSCSVSDTNCIDMLHSPNEMALLSSEMWQELKALRKSLYAKNMKGLIGYIKTQSKKYTNKIDRFKEMQSLLDHLERVVVLGEEDPYIEDFVNILKKENNFSYKHITSVTKPTPLKFGTDIDHSYLDVCGKKYIYTWKVSFLKDALQKEIKRYGERTLEGAGKGLDTKSLSHALRVLLQVKEIVETNDLNFPLKEKDIILKVKQGNITDLEEIFTMIDYLYDSCMNDLQRSDLPDQVDVTDMKEIVLKYYFHDCLL